MTKLTAYRGDQDEPWRMERLQRVAKDCPFKVLALDDHKGTLSINWSSGPTLRDVERMGIAWGMEGEWLIDHYVKGKPYCVENGGNPFEKAKADA